MQVKDPVCGKAFDIDRAVAHVEVHGWLHLFCSTDCHARFLADPDRYGSVDPRARRERSSSEKKQGARHD